MHEPLRYGRTEKIAIIKKEASKKTFAVMMKMALEFEQNSDTGSWVQ